MFCSAVSETAGLRSIVALPGRVQSSSTLSRVQPRRSTHSLIFTRSVIHQSSLVNVCLKRKGITVRRVDQQHSVSSVVRSQASRWVGYTIVEYDTF